jgi:branched-chain amino acid transport system ATP-binding protein
MSAASLLKVEGLETAYGASQVLFGIDLEVRAGEVVGLLGRNGMGKTTLIRSVIGLVAARAGSVAIDGREVRGTSADRIARLGVAVVPEGRQVFPNLSVDEHLTAFAARRGGEARGEPWDAKRVYALFPRLAERRDNLGNQLSGGEQQMLAIGRALVTNPRLLILDEATEGLAPLIAREIWRICDLIKQSGISSVIVDKNWKHVTQVTDRNVILVKGEVVFAGSSDELRATPQILEQHLGV